MDQLPEITPDVCSQVPEQIQGVCKTCLSVESYTLEKDISEYNIASGEFTGKDAKKACVLGAVHNGQQPPASQGSAPPPVQKMDAHLQKINIT